MAAYCLHIFLSKIYSGNKGKKTCLHWLDSCLQQPYCPVEHTLQVTAKQIIFLKKILALIVSAAWDIKHAWKDIFMLPSDFTSFVCEGFHTCPSNYNLFQGSIRNMSQLEWLVGNWYASSIPRHINTCTTAIHRHLFFSQQAKPPILEAARVSQPSWTKDKRDVKNNVHM
jgi:hypothetical protein